MDSAETEFTPVCYRHADRETGLRCTECERPICVDCSRDAAVGQKCPECAKPIGRNRVVTARSMKQVTPVVAVIIGSAITAFIAQYTVPGFEERLLQINFRVQEGELWRLLSAAWLHSRGLIFHILLNMYFVWRLGPALERSFGSVPFALLYVASALSGGAAFLALGDPFSAALGASGAVFGLIGAWFVATFESRRTPAGNAQFRSIGSLLLLNLALPLFIPNIAWEAHLGGLVAGMAVMWAWLRIPRGPKGLPARAGVAAAVAVVAVSIALVV